MTDRFHPLAAGSGTAIGLGTGDRVRIRNAHGGQVVDTWAFARPDPAEHLSMEHTRTTLERITLTVGDHLLSSRRNPMLALVEDTSPGVHDTLVAACDPARYASLGARADHPNCADNLRAALRTAGQEVPVIPAPLNLFMNVRWDRDGHLTWLPSPARPGDAVVLEALMPQWLVLSACPMDVNPINGHRPRPVDYQVRTRAPSLS
ncbi:urea carboxylase-associated family protein [Amycolatopsis acidicola]|uniref:Urea carboxylase-associated family protein n=1 Tax=Amycolatopsis acidicola TaxID=2596893 RepID=A0A5N0V422_9PSEU|nr:urea carboxylase-associated family protein [Amycolatopsis acidicola]KAA9160534.1 urea carboxylase-associated family protein [Amycolatopsis acidicola]